MTGLIRIVLLLLPLVGLIFWIKSRARRGASGELSEDDIKHLRLGLVGLVILLLVAGLGIRMTEDSSNGDGRYVPARVENGKTIPGHFVVDEPEAKPDAAPDKAPDAAREAAPDAASNTAPDAPSQPARDKDDRGTPSS